MHTTSHRASPSRFSHDNFDTDPTVYQPGNPEEEEDEQEKHDVYHRRSSPQHFAHHHHPAEGASLNTSLASHSSAHGNAARFHGSGLVRRHSPTLVLETGDGTIVRPASELIELANSRVGPDINQRDEQSSPPHSSPTRDRSESPTNLPKWSSELQELGAQLKDNWTDGERLLAGLEAREAGRVQGVRDQSRRHVDQLAELAEDTVQQREELRERELAQHLMQFDELEKAWKEDFDTEFEAQEARWRDRERILLNQIGELRSELERSAASVPPVGVEIADVKGVRAVRVVNVKGLAQQAGLKEGDLVTHASTLTGIPHKRAFRSWLQMVRAGTSLKLHVNRDGREREVVFEADWRSGI
eukprot:NODE_773_length_1351_cov_223.107527_g586_i0.p1 GENE.NODE_773_length_1351_cov_223.107527_g586_i0~~NODE_773_length_1351_cov_223.107527_g586_i0.p1  ORF type:complete len:358 (-),score=88.55 NODE_773_length_1351_cov_223.107527_g586_i0:116-1189(-)